MAQQKDSSMLLQQQRYNEVYSEAYIKACTGLERTIVLKKAEFSRMCASDVTTCSSFVCMEQDISVLENVLEKVIVCMHPRPKPQVIFKQHMLPTPPDSFSPIIGGSTHVSSTKMQCQKKCRD